MQINNLSDRIAKSRSAIDAAIARVLDRAWLVLGPEVKDFEKSFAAYVGVEHCVTVANGTDALELALRALGVQAGDQVATVANAGMYTTTALLSIGAEPVFMDVDIATRVVLPLEIERIIQLGVKVVVVTHLYGQAIPGITEIASRCRTAGVALLEDCAQAHGAKICGKQVGSFGDAGCFSFYPTKNLGALGDGGAVVSNSSALAEKIACLRQYGWTTKYETQLAGARNSRLDEIQAAILSVFLPQLDAWNARRKAIALAYVDRITNPQIRLPKIVGEDYVAHLFVVTSSERDALRNYLRQYDISTDIHYPIPDYRQPIFKNRYSNIFLASTEILSREVLTLPCYPEMSDAEVEHVINTINSWHMVLAEGIK